MQKFLFGLLTCVALLPGCSKDSTDDYTILETEESAAIKAIIKEYSIQKEGLIIESFINNLDSTTLYVNGRIKECLWVGGYDIATKKQIIDFAENSKLDTSISHDLGYGEYSKFDIDKYMILPNPYSLNSSTCFILSGKERGGSGTNMSSDLYFLQGNTLKKKHRSVFSPSTTRHYQKITPWFESVMIYVNPGEFQCFSFQGDNLFNANNYYIESSEPISLEECIYFVVNEPKSFIAERINVKTGISIWKKHIQPFVEKVKIENYKIVKSNSIWTYSISYTNFSGTKGNIQISLNIEDGNFEIK